MPSQNPLKSANFHKIFVKLIKVAENSRFILTQLRLVRSTYEVVQFLTKNSSEALFSPILLLKPLSMPYEGISKLSFGGYFLVFLKFF